MVTHLPHNLQKLLEVTVGMPWPEGSEDDLWDLASAWDTFGKDLDGLATSLAVEANKFTEAIQGQTGDRLNALLAIEMHDTAVQLKTQADAYAKMVKNAAADIQKTKVMIIVMLAILAATLASLFASIFGSFAVPSVIAAARVGIGALLRSLLSRLMEVGLVNIARELAVKATIGGIVGAGFMVGLDSGIQAGQIAAGKRKGFDTASLKGDAIGGAIGGALGGLAEGIAGVASKVGRDLWQRLPKSVRGFAPLGSTMLQIPAAALGNPLINTATHSPGNTIDGIFGALDPGTGGHAHAKIPHVDIPGIRPLGDLKLTSTPLVPGLGTAVAPLTTTAGKPIGSAFTPAGVQRSTTPSQPAQTSRSAAPVATRSADRPAAESAPPRGRTAAKNSRAAAGDGGERGQTASRPQPLAAGSDGGDARRGMSRTPGTERPVGVTETSGTGRESAGSVVSVAQGRTADSGVSGGGVDGQRGMSRTPGTERPVGVTETSGTGRENAGSVVSVAQGRTADSGVSGGGADGVRGVGRTSGAVGVTETSGTGRENTGSVVPVAQGRTADSGAPGGHTETQQAPVGRAGSESQPTAGRGSVDPVSETRLSRESAMPTAGDRSEVSGTRTGDGSGKRATAATTAPVGERGGDARSSAVPTESSATTKPAATTGGVPERGDTRSAPVERGASTSDGRGTETAPVRTTSAPAAVVAKAEPFGTAAHLVEQGGVRYDLGGKPADSGTGQWRTADGPAERANAPRPVGEGVPRTWNPVTAARRLGSVLGLVKTEVVEGVLVPASDSKTGRPLTFHSSDARIHRLYRDGEVVGVSFLGGKQLAVDRLAVTIPGPAASTFLPENYKYEDWRRAEGEGLVRHREVPWPDNSFYVTTHGLTDRFHVRLNTGRDVYTNGASFGNLLHDLRPFRDGVAQRAPEALALVVCEVGRTDAPGFGAHDLQRALESFGYPQPVVASTQSVGWHVTEPGGTWLENGGTWRTIGSGQSLLLGQELNVGGEWRAFGSAEVRAVPLVRAGKTVGVSFGQAAWTDRAVDWAAAGTRSGDGTPWPHRSFFVDADTLSAGDFVVRTADGRVMRVEGSSFGRLVANTTALREAVAAGADAPQALVLMSSSAAQPLPGGRTASVDFHDAVRKEFGTAPPVYASTGDLELRGDGGSRTLHQFDGEWAVHSDGPAPLPAMDATGLRQLFHAEDVLATALFRDDDPVGLAFHQGDRLEAVRGWDGRPQDGAPWSKDAFFIAAPATSSAFEVHTGDGRRLWVDGTTFAKVVVSLKSFQDAMNAETRQVGQTWSDRVSGITLLASAAGTLAAEGGAAHDFQLAMRDRFGYRQPMHAPSGQIGIRRPEHGDAVVVLSEGARWRSFPDGPLPLPGIDVATGKRFWVEPAQVRTTALHHGDDVIGMSFKADADTARQWAAGTGRDRAHHLGGDHFDLAKARAAGEVTTRRAPWPDRAFVVDVLPAETRFTIITGSTHVSVDGTAFAELVGRSKPFRSAMTGRHAEAVVLLTLSAEERPGAVSPAAEFHQALAERFGYQGAVHAPTDLLDLHVEDGVSSTVLSGGGEWRTFEAEPTLSDFLTGPAERRAGAVQSVPRTVWSTNVPPVDSALSGLDVRNSRTRLFQHSDVRVTPLQDRGRLVGVSFAVGHDRHVDLNWAPSEKARTSYLFPGQYSRAGLFDPALATAVARPWPERALYITGHGTERHVILALADGTELRVDGATLAKLVRDLGILDAAAQRETDAVVLLICRAAAIDGPGGPAHDFQRALEEISGFRQPVHAASADLLLGFRNGEAITAVEHGGVWRQFPARDLAVPVEQVRAAEPGEATMESRRAGDYGPTAKRGPVVRPSAASRSLNRIFGNRTELLTGLDEAGAARSFRRDDVVMRKLLSDGRPVGASFRAGSGPVPVPVTAGKPVFHVDVDSHGRLFEVTLADGSAVSVNGQTFAKIVAKSAPFAAQGKFGAVAVPGSRPVLAVEFQRALAGLGRSEAVVTDSGTGRWRVVGQPPRRPTLAGKGDTGLVHLFAAHEVQHSLLTAGHRTVGVSFLDGQALERDLAWASTPLDRPGEPWIDPAGEELRSVVQGDRFLVSADGTPEGARLRLTDGRGIVVGGTELATVLGALDLFRFERGHHGRLSFALAIPYAAADTVPGGTAHDFRMALEEGFGVLRPVVAPSAKVEKLITEDGRSETWATGGEWRSFPATAVIEDLRLSGIEPATAIARRFRASEVEITPLSHEGQVLGASFTTTFERYLQKGWDQAEQDPFTYLLQGVLVTDNIDDAVAKTVAPRPWPDGPFFVKAHGSADGVVVNLRNGTPLAVDGATFARLLNDVRFFHNAMRRDVPDAIVMLVCSVAAVDGPGGVAHDFQRTLAAASGYQRPVFAASDVVMTDYRNDRAITVVEHGGVWRRYETPDELLVRRAGPSTVERLSGLFGRRRRVPGAEVFDNIPLRGSGSKAVAFRSSDVRVRVLEKDGRPVGLSFTRSPDPRAEAAMTAGGPLTAQWPRNSFFVAAKGKAELFEASLVDGTTVRLDGPAFARLVHDLRGFRAAIDRSAPEALVLLGSDAGKREGPGGAAEGFQSALGGLGYRQPVVAAVDGGGWRVLSSGPADLLGMENSSREIVAFRPEDAEVRPVRRHGKTIGVTFRSGDGPEISAPGRPFLVETNPTLDERFAVNLADGRLVVVDAPSLATVVARSEPFRTATRYWARPDSVTFLRQGVRVGRGADLAAAFTRALSRESGVHLQLTDAVRWSRELAPTAHLPFGTDATGGLRRFEPAEVRVAALVADTGPIGVTFLTGKDKKHALKWGSAHPWTSKGYTYPHPEAGPSRFPGNEGAPRVSAPWKAYQAAYLSVAGGADRFEVELADGARLALDGTNFARLVAGLDVFRRVAAANPRAELVLLAGRTAEIAGPGGVAHDFARTLVEELGYRRSVIAPSTGLHLRVKKPDGAETVLDRGGEWRVFAPDRPLTTLSDVLLHGQRKDGRGSHAFKVSEVDVEPLVVNGRVTGVSFITGEDRVGHHYREGDADSVQRFAGDVRTEADMIEAREQGRFEHLARPWSGDTFHVALHGHRTHGGIRLTDGTALQINGRTLAKLVTDLRVVRDALGERESDTVALVACHAGYLDEPGGLAYDFERALTEFGVRRQVVAITEAGFAGLQEPVSALHLAVLNGGTWRRFPAGAGAPGWLRPVRAAGTVEGTTLPSGEPRRFEAGEVEVVPLFDGVRRIGLTFHTGAAVKQHLKWASGSERARGPWGEDAVFLAVPGDADAFRVELSDGTRVRLDGSNFAKLAAGMRQFKAMADENPAGTLVLLASGSGSRTGPGGAAHDFAGAMADFRARRTVVAPTTELTVSRNEGITLGGRGRWQVFPATPSDTPLARVGLPGPDELVLRPLDGLWRSITWLYNSWRADVVDGVALSGAMLDTGAGVEFGSAQVRAYHLKDGNGATIGITFGAGNDLASDQHVFGRRPDPTTLAYPVGVETSRAALGATSFAVRSVPWPSGSFVVTTHGDPRHVMLTLDDGRVIGVDGATLARLAHDLRPFRDTLSTGGPESITLIACGTGADGWPGGAAYDFQVKLTELGYRHPVFAPTTIVGMGVSNEARWQTALLEGGRWRTLDAAPARLVGRDTRKQWHTFEPEGVRATLLAHDGRTVGVSFRTNELTRSYVLNWAAAGTPRLDGGKWPGGTFFIDAEVTPDGRAVIVDELGRTLILDGHGFGGLVGRTELFRAAVAGAEPPSLLALLAQQPGRRNDAARQRDFMAALESRFHVWAPTGQVWVELDEGGHVVDGGRWRTEDGTGIPPEPPTSARLFDEPRFSSNADDGPAVVEDAELTGTLSGSDIAYPFETSEVRVAALERDGRVVGVTFRGRADRDLAWARGEAPGEWSARDRDVLPWPKNTFFVSARDMIEPVAAVKLDNGAKVTVNGETLARLVHDLTVFRSAVADGTARGIALLVPYASDVDGPGGLAHDFQATLAGEFGYRQPVLAPSAGIEAVVLGDGTSATRLTGGQWRKFAQPAVIDDIELSGVRRQGATPITFRSSQVRVTALGENGRVFGASFKSDADALAFESHWARIPKMDETWYFDGKAAPHTPVAARGPKPWPDNSFHVIAHGAAERVTVTLNDGTAVWLSGAAFARLLGDVRLFQTVLRRDQPDAVLLLPCFAAAERGPGGVAHDFERVLSTEFGLPLPVFAGTTETSMMIRREGSATVLSHNGEWVRYPAGEISAAPRQDVADPGGADFRSNAEVEFLGDSFLNGTDLLTGEQRMFASYDVQVETFTHEGQFVGVTFSGEADRVIEARLAAAVTPETGFVVAAPGIAGHALLRLADGTALGVDGSTLAMLVQQTDVFRAAVGPQRPDTILLMVADDGTSGFGSRFQAVLAEDYGYRQPVVGLVDPRTVPDTVEGLRWNYLSAPTVVEDVVLRGVDIATGHPLSIRSSEVLVSVLQTDDQVIGASFWTGAEHWREVAWAASGPTDSRLLEDAFIVSAPGMGGLAHVRSIHGAEVGVDGTTLGRLLHDVRFFQAAMAVETPSQFALLVSQASTVDGRGGLAHDFQAVLAGDFGFTAKAFGPTSEVLRTHTAVSLAEGGVWRRYRLTPLRDDISLTGLERDTGELISFKASEVVMKPMIRAGKPIGVTFRRPGLEVAPWEDQRDSRDTDLGWARAPQADTTMLLRGAAGAVLDMTDRSALIVAPRPWPDQTFYVTTHGLGQVAELRLDEGRRVLVTGVELARLVGDLRFFHTALNRDGAAAITLLVCSAAVVDGPGGVAYDFYHQLASSTPVPRPVFGAEQVMGIFQLPGTNAATTAIEHGGRWRRYPTLQSAVGRISRRAPAAEPFATPVRTDVALLLGRNRIDGSVRTFRPAQVEVSPLTRDGRVVGMTFFTGAEAERDLRWVAGSARNERRPWPADAFLISVPTTAKQAFVSLADGTEVGVNGTTLATVARRIEIFRSAVDSGEASVLALVGSDAGRLDDGGVAYTFQATLAKTFGQRQEVTAPVSRLDPAVRSGGDWRRFTWPTVLDDLTLTGTHERTGAPVEFRTSQVRIEPIELNGRVAGATFWAERGRAERDLAAAARRWPEKAGLVAAPGSRGEAVVRLMDGTDVRLDGPALAVLLRDVAFFRGPLESGRMPAVALMIDGSAGLGPDFQATLVRRFGHHQPVFAPSGAWTDEAEPWSSFAETPVVHDLVIEGVDAAFQTPVTFRVSDVRVVPMEHGGKVIGASFTVGTERNFDRGWSRAEKSGTAYRIDEASIADSVEFVETPAPWPSKVFHVSTHGAPEQAFVHLRDGTEVGLTGANFARVLGDLRFFGAAMRGERPNAIVLLVCRSAAIDGAGGLAHDFRATLRQEFRYPHTVFGASQTVELVAAAGRPATVAVVNGGVWRRYPATSVWAADPVQANPAGFGSASISRRGAGPSRPMPDEAGPSLIGIEVPSGRIRTFQPALVHSTALVADGRTLGISFARGTMLRHDKAFARGDAGTRQVTHALQAKDPADAPMLADRGASRYPVPWPDDPFYLTTHGTWKSAQLHHVDGTVISVDGTQFARLVMALSPFRDAVAPGDRRPIVLLICSTGAVSSEGGLAFDFQRTLAAESGHRQPVVAPSDTVWVSTMVAPGAWRQLLRTGKLRYHGTTAMRQSAQWRTFAAAPSGLLGVDALRRWHYFDAAEVRATPLNADGRTVGVSFRAVPGEAPAVTRGAPWPARAFFVELTQAGDEHSVRLTDGRTLRVDAAAYARVIAESAPFRAAAGEHRAESLVLLPDDPRRGTMTPTSAENLRRALNRYAGYQRPVFVTDSTGSVESAHWRMLLSERPLVAAGADGAIHFVYPGDIAVTPVTVDGRQVGISYRPADEPTGREDVPERMFTIDAEPAERSGFQVRLADGTPVRLPEDAFARLVASAEPVLEVLRAGELSGLMITGSEAFSWVVAAELGKTFGRQPRVNSWQVTARGRRSHFGPDGPLLTPARLGTSASRKTQARGYRAFAPHADVPAPGRREELRNFLTGKGSS